MAKLEIACFNTESAQIAQDNGADRIEFCSDFSQGGLTPDFAQTEQLRDRIHIPMTIMIRPRGGNFVYDEEEFEEMKEAINAFQTLNVDGFVFGVLDADGLIDVQRNKALVELAAPLPCIMHRAFDRTPSLQAALESTLACGFQSLLTSGHAPNVDQGAKNLRKMVESTKGRAFDIMPGGGLRSSNLAKIQSLVGAPYYHSSAIREGDIADADEIRALKSLLT